MPQAGKPLLRGDRLELGYHGEPVVRDASIQLYAGRVTALVGPNGSGKSTLLRALARLLRPTHGDIRVGEGPAAAMSAKEFARLVTLLSQARPTPSGVRVADVVGYGRYPYKSRWRGSGNDPGGPAAIAHAMEVTGLTAMAERPADELSGGELQRVWLAMCLAQDTRVLLLDEPTTFLDLRYQVETLDLIRELADAHDVAVGVVLHDLNQAALIADEVLLLHQGTVRASGPPQDVLTAEHLTEVYGIRIDVAVDPATGALTARPVGRHSSRERSQPATTP